jgi:hypothetical protein
VDFGSEWTCTSAGPTTAGLNVHSDPISLSRRHFDIVRRRLLTKSRSKRRSVTRGVTREDVLSFLGDQRIDQVADYANRGRRHRDLSDAWLLETWLAAFRTMAANPLSEQARADEIDLAAELQLRGQLVRYDLVEDELDAYIAKVDKLSALKRGDPNEWHRINDELTRDIVEFKARRDTNKN